MWRFDSLLARVWLGNAPVGDLAKTEGNRDVMSVNTAKGGEGSTVELGLGDNEEDRGELDEGDQDSLEIEEYEKRLEQAIGVCERAPAYFLQ
jgi:hypothetical protein